MLLIPVDLECFLSRPGIDLSLSDALGEDEDVGKCLSVACGLMLFCLICYRGKMIPD